MRTNKLNDPFDPNFDIAPDFDYSAFLEYVKNNKPRAEYEELERRPSQEKFERAKTGLDEKMKKRKESTFVFSTCEASDPHPRDNLYMWGHYANGHRGVAIEFNSETLTQAVLTQNKELNGGKVSEDNVWWKIEYFGKFPKITCPMFYDFWVKGIEKELESHIEQVINSKSDFWEKEKEWRFVRFNDETMQSVWRTSIQDNTITAVYLGCRINEMEEKKIISATARHFPNAKIFKAAKRTGEFALDFEERSPSARQP